MSRPGAHDIPAPDLIASRGEAPNHVPVTPNVIGVDELLSKKSAVDQSGNLRNQPIDGVIFRPTRPVPHEDGHVTEVARASWEILQAPVVQVHITTTFPGRVRAGDCIHSGRIGFLL